MALVGISAAEAQDYVSDMDPCKRVIETPVDPADPSKGVKKETVIDEGATVFSLAGLDCFLMAKIYDDTSHLTRNTAEVAEFGLKTRINQTNVEAVRYGLKGWEHLTDAKGNDMPFSTVKRTHDGREYTVASDACLARLGVRLISELGDRIKAMSEVTKAEAKN
jgi:hypothetical protein